jgi:lactose/L-arabinose transport system ATP-binding protein
MTNVILRDVKKSFGKVDVIHGVDLNIQSGEFVVFVGPSGCGKSTLLRLISGLEDTSAGTIEIGEQDVTHVEAADRGIAMVFQSYALYPHMSVAENMGFGLKMTGSSKAEVAERVGRAAEILHLGPLLDRKPKALSGGQRQRVAIGRAIVRQPKVFLFDEPLSNLDAELRVQMRLEISKLHKDLRSTMIYVTHDQVEAMTLADKIVVLRAGRVEQFGSPLELYRNPDNVFVGGFIGSPRMNFLAGTVRSVSGGSVTVTLDGYAGSEMTKMLESPPSVGSKVLIGIRPEHFAEGGATRLELQIDVIENLGGVAYGYAGAESETPLTIQLNEGHTAEEDGALVIGFEPERAFVFDATSERRLR